VKPRFAPLAECDEALRETLESMEGMSARAIAKRLNELGIEPPRAGAWSHMTVLRVKTRLANRENALTSPDAGWQKDGQFGHKYNMT
jgi:hypothetical protein